MVDPPLDIVLEMVRGVGSPVAPLTLPALESNLRDEALSNYCVFLLRMITRWAGAVGVPGLASPPQLGRAQSNSCLFPWRHTITG